MSIIFLIVSNAFQPWKIKQALHCTFVLIFQDFFTDRKFICLMYLNLFFYFFMWVGEWKSSGENRSFRVIGGWWTEACSSTGEFTWRIHYNRMLITNTCSCFAGKKEQSRRLITHPSIVSMNSRKPVRTDPGKPGKLRTSYRTVSPGINLERHMRLTCTFSRISFIVSRSYYNKSYVKIFLNCFI